MYIQVRKGNVWRGLENSDDVIYSSIEEVYDYENACREFYDLTDWKEYLDGQESGKYSLWFIGTDELDEYSDTEYEDVENPMIRRIDMDGFEVIETIDDGDYSNLTKRPPTLYEIQCEAEIKRKEQEKEAEKKRFEESESKRRVRDSYDEDEKPKEKLTGNSPYYSYYLGNVIGHGRSREAARKDAERQSEEENKW